MQHDTDKATLLQTEVNLDSQGAKDYNTEGTSSAVKIAN
jgi:hypothetical protein